MTITGDDIMTITGDDIVALATGGVLVNPIKPATPTLSIAADAGAVTATIDGDSGVTNYLKYKAGSQMSWQDGGSREGDGDLVVSGLADDVAYIFVVYSQNAGGVVSLPSIAAVVTFTETAANQTDQMLIDTANDFLTEFGEPIKYLPAGGGSRGITAIVDREPPAELEGMPGVHASRLVISVANRCIAYKGINGISSSEINISKDKAELAVRINETAVEKLITKIISQDAGIMKLEVR